MCQLFFGQENFIVKKDLIFYFKKGEAIREWQEKSGLGMILVDLLKRMASG